MDPASGHLPFSGKILIVTQPVTRGQVIGQFSNPFVGRQQQPWGKLLRQTHLGANPLILLP
jgi:hypothetical protein